MSKVSKTARASMGSGLVVKEKKVIPDEVYIKNLRIDLESGLYVAQEGARVLLRTYDAALKSISALNAELKAALSQIETLAKELDAAQHQAKPSSGSSQYQRVLDDPENEAV